MSRRCFRERARLPSCSPKRRAYKHSQMQPHEGQDRKPDPNERERQRQRRMSVRLLLVIGVLLGLLTPLLLKRLFL